MPPQIALWLCLALCAGVFWYDRRNHLPAGPELWLSTLWFMRCASRNVGFWLASGGDAESTEGSNVDAYLLLVLALAAWYSLSRHSAQVKDVLSRNRWLVALFVYMAISVVWSDIPFISAKRWVRASGDLAMALILAIQVDAFAALKLCFRRVFLLLIPLSIVLSKYFPNLGRAQEKNWSADTWIGVATHKNTLGMLCLLSAFYFLTELISLKRHTRQSWVKLLRAHPVDCIYLLFSLYLLTGGGAERNSVSSTSLLLFFIAAGSYIALGLFRNRPSAVGPILITVVMAIGIAHVIVTYGLDSSLRALVASTQGKDPTLAERTNLWDALLKEGEAHPILGAGYGGFWSEAMGAHMQQAFTWGPWQSHNGYIETYINIGLVGLLLLAATALKGISNAVKRCMTNFDHGTWCLVLLICTLIHNYTEAGFPRPTHVVWFVFLVVVSNSSALVLPEPQEEPELDHEL